MLPAYAAPGHVRERIGSGTEYVVPHNHYRAGDGGWIAIACTNDRMFERLLGALGRPELLGRYRTMADRIRLRDELDAVGSDWVGGLSAREALRRLDLAAVPRSLV